MKNRQNLIDFIEASNAIEGIGHRCATGDEIDVHVEMMFEPLTVGLLSRFVSVVQPDAVLRSRRGMNVRVGRHVAPPGGAAVVERLTDLLGVAAAGTRSAFEVHCDYLTLHPYTDGNGRSARALWLRMMPDPFERSFLHEFYYQALDHADGRK